MSQQINLFNPIFLKQKKYFSAVTMAQGLGLILAGSIVLTVYAKFQLAELTEKSVAASEQLLAARTQLAKVTAEYAPKQKSKALEEELQRVESEAKAQAQALKIVQEGGVGNTKGYSEYFRAFSRQIISGLWLTGFAIDGTGNSIEMKGRALQPELVPAYINRLKNESVMQGKSFSALVMELPQLTPEAAADPAVAAAKKNSPPYIEFTLKSGESGAASTIRQAAEAIGAKRE